MEIRTIYIWADDLRDMPSDYDFWYKSVWDFIRDFEQSYTTPKGDYHCVIDLDHDAGDYERFGGDYYNILKWLEYYDSEFVKEHCTFKFHTANPVGRENMINICDRNGWKYER